MLLGSPVTERIQGPNRRKNIFLSQFEISEVHPAKLTDIE
jgi:hypothetical protein